MYRIVVLSLVSAAALSLFGCGETAKTNSSSQKPDEPATDGSRDPYALVFERGNEIFYSENGGERKLAHVAPDVPAVWSPDGREIAFISGGESPGDLRIIQPDGRNDRILVQKGNNTFHHLRYSHEPACLAAVTDRPSAIWVFSADEKNSHSQVLCIDQRVVRAPVWSPNDRRIAFVTVRKDSMSATTNDTAGETTDVVVANILKADEQGAAADEKRAKRLVVQNADSPQWNSDNETLYYVKKTGSYSQIIAHHLPTDRTRPVTSSPVNKSQCLLSPNERWIAYIASPAADIRELWIVPSSGGAGRKLCRYEVQVVQEQFCWAANSEAIAIALGQRSNGRIELVTLDGQPPRTLAASGAQFPDMRPSGLPH